MPEKKKSILLRISPELWEKLNIWARDDLRSLNAQIEYILREAARKRSGKDKNGASENDDSPIGRPRRPTSGEGA